MRLIESSSRARKASDPETFVPPATTQALLSADDGYAARLYMVAFEEGARTYWHAHDEPQLLYGIAGTCVVVDRDGDEIFLEEGDIVVIEPGEEHWHGAAPGCTGEHLAINLGSDTTWLESSE